MNTKPEKTTFVFTMYIMVILAVVLSYSTVAYAAPPSPFVGHWQAIDVDGSDIRLSIGGPPYGPYQITWTESSISFCEGEAGIVRGTGWLNEEDANVLEADLHVECFTTGASLDFHLSFRYHSATNMLSTRYTFGNVTIFHRPGGGQVEAPPVLGLRVNYGHDWVESFYEAGHMAWITVTDNNGNVRATTELLTEPKDYWDGESGFQSSDSAWFDGEGNQLDNPPDIQPFDWVYGWVDNGASTQVQIGEISGKVHLREDFIEGTINVPWFSNDLEVDCHSWGAPLPEEVLKYDTVLPNGEDMYSCSWSGDWDIEPYQDIGVGYSGPDGNWVANVIIPPNPRIVASEAGDWFWVTEFYPGLLDLFIYESADQGAALLWSGQQEATDLWGITSVAPDVHNQNLGEDNYLVVSDGVNQKELVLEPITIEVFDTINEIMAGTAPLGGDVWAMAGPQDWQQPFLVQADPDTGAWLADFKTLPEPFDLTEDMRMWSYAHIYDDDGDANEGNTPPSPEIRAWLGNQRVEGYQWPLDEWVSVEIYDPIGDDIFSDSQQVIDTEWGSFVAFNLQGWQLQPGQIITMRGSMTEKVHEILPVSITSVDTEMNVVYGTASREGGIVLCVYDGGCEPPAEVNADESGIWSMDYGEALDILPGFGMDVTEFDDDGDGTSFDYWVP